MALYSERAENTLKITWHFLLRLLIIGAVFYACYRLRNIIITLFIAAIVAYVLDPLIDWLCRQDSFVRFHTAVALRSSEVVSAYRRLFYKQISTPVGRVRLHKHALRVYATLYVFVLALVVLWQGTRLILTPFSEEIRAASSLKQQQKIRREIDRRLRDYDDQAPAYAKSDRIRDEIRKVNFAQYVEKMVAETGRKVLEGAKNIVEVVVLPVMAFYFLIDGRKLKHEFVGLVPQKYMRETVRMTNEFNRIMRAFVFGQIILCTLAGVVVG